MEMSNILDKLNADPEFNLPLLTAENSGRVSTSELISNPVPASPVRIVRAEIKSVGFEVACGSCGQQFKAPCPEDYDVWDYTEMKGTYVCPSCGGFNKVYLPK